MLRRTATLSVIVGTFLVFMAQPASAWDSVPLCHATPGGEYPYEKVVDDPSLHYQVHADDIIPAFSWEGIDYPAQGDQSLLDYDHCVKPPEPTTTTAPPTTTTTTAPPTTTTAAAPSSTTTQPPAVVVEPAQITSPPPPAPAPKVEPAALPRTGSGTEGLFYLGMVFTLLGIGLGVTCRTLNGPSKP